MSSASQLRQPLNGFLALAPTTSSGYPRAPQTQPTVQAPEAPAAQTAEASPKIGAGLARRSSSVSTVNSNSGLRFLKLGPVHYGEHQAGNEGGDWSAANESAVSE